MPKAKNYDEHYKYYTESAGVLVIYCKGCKSKHYIHTKEKNSNNAIWSFNNDYNKPTFSPSIHITVDLQPDDEVKTLCHFFINDGMIQYLDDCAHELKGQTIELPEII